MAAVSRSLLWSCVKDLLVDLCLGDCTPARPEYEEHSLGARTPWLWIFSMQRTNLITRIRHWTFRVSVYDEEENGRWHRKYSAIVFSAKHRTVNNKFVWIFLEFWKIFLWLSAETNSLNFFWLPNLPSGNKEHLRSFWITHIKGATNNFFGNREHY
jgi:hypothetical protein